MRALHTGVIDFFEEVKRVLSKDISEFKLGEYVSNYGPERVSGKVVAIVSSDRRRGTEPLNNASTVEVYRVPGVNRALASRYMQPLRLLPN
jgi:hypothetical protein